MLQTVTVKQAVISDFNVMLGNIRQLYCRTTITQYRRSVETICGTKIQTDIKFFIDIKHFHIDLENSYIYSMQWVQSCLYFIRRKTKVPYSRSGAALTGDKSFLFTYVHHGYPQRKTMLVFLKPARLRLKKLI